MRATIIEGVDPHGILVPQSAVGHDQKGQPTALVVDAKNFARLRVLKTGRAIGSDWQVLDGPQARRPADRRGPGQGAARHAGAIRSRRPGSARRPDQHAVH